MRAIGVRNGLRERLAHVRAGMKAKPQQSCTLNGLCLHALNAIDVQEVVLVVIRDKTFHLLWAHATVGLRDIDDRQVQSGKDVDARSQNRQDRREGYRRHDDDDRDRTS